MPGGVLKGFLKGVLQLEESLGWKREVLNVILEDGREGGRGNEIGVAYTGTAVRSTSRMVGERDKSINININITRFNTSSDAGAARLPTCCAVPVRYTPNEDNLSENLMARDCVKISKYLPRFSSLSHICLFLGASTNTDFSLGLRLQPAGAKRRSYLVSIKILRQCWCIIKGLVGKGQGEMGTLYSFHSIYGFHLGGRMGCRGKWGGCMQRQVGADVCTVVVRAHQLGTSLPAHTSGCRGMEHLSCPKTKAYHQPEIKETKTG
ncbi:hypothetical protein B0H16DRAFT_1462655 [Mycena metata]|uniref:Uncharacterized protein n=1 Tax=Mycena metata TaxID=1033252 RepID=A0AAD7N4Y0_9AGAR|nr:hypothetical protein B0H16DRAFT_1462655 [Mycena metata]